MSSRPWVFCQIGAREHYVLAREFHRRGQLAALITDFWISPGSWLTRLPDASSRRFSDRYHEDLADAYVIDFNNSAAVRETVRRLSLSHHSGWETIIARNNWFQRQATYALEKTQILAARPIVFAYSYAALGILAKAREAGCLTVLGQIDPAIHEENIVDVASRRHAAIAPAWQRAPEHYWDLWREECALADRIVVNSVWSRDGLIKAGIPAEKLRVVPLAYQADGAHSQRVYPRKFTAERPLRILFLGSLTIRKGIAELLEAAQMMKDAPVEFHLVGPEEITFPPDASVNPAIFRHGPVRRSAVDEHYASADLFILPTLSDGFALTQIEAHSHGLPVIASRCCGDVARDGVDGLLLNEPTALAIVDAVTRYLADPTILGQHSLAASKSANRHAPERISRMLSEIAEEAGG